MLGGIKTQKIETEVQVVGESLSKADDRTVYAQKGFTTYRVNENINENAN